MMTAYEEAAFAADPEARELQRLTDLRDRGGWRFNVQRNIEGEQTAFIIGVCSWPDGSADVLVVRNFTAAHGRRTDPSGGVVWRHDEAAVGEVVDALLTLPAPDDPSAPTRIIGTGPGLWTSG